MALDGLTGEQLLSLRRQADGWLVVAAEDLRLLHREADPRRAVREVAALGRLTRALGRGELAVPDRVVRDLVGRRTAETILLEELREEYERELAEHEAWLALLAHPGKEAGDA